MILRLHSTKIWTLVVLFSFSPSQSNTSDSRISWILQFHVVEILMDSDSVWGRAHIPDASCHGTFRIRASWTMSVGRDIGPWFWLHVILLQRDLTGGAAAAAAANVDILNPGMWERHDALAQSVKTCKYDLPRVMSTYVYVHIWHNRNDTCIHTLTYSHTDACI